MCETRGRRLLARGLLLNFIMNIGRDDRIRTCYPTPPVPPTPLKRPSARALTLGITLFNNTPN